MQFDRLPNELLVQIGSYLPIKEIQVLVEKVKRDNIDIYLYRHTILNFIQSLVNIYKKIVITI